MHLQQQKGCQQCKAQSSKRVGPVSEERAQACNQWCTARHVPARPPVLDRQLLLLANARVSPQVGVGGVEGAGGAVAIEAEASEHAAAWGGAARERRAGQREARAKRLNQQRGVGSVARPWESSWKGPALAQLPRGLTC